jgi:hypothetical protein
MRREKERERVGKCLIPGILQSRGQEQVGHFAEDSGHCGKAVLLASTTLYRSVREFSLPIGSFWKSLFGFSRSPWFLPPVSHDTLPALLRVPNINKPLRKSLTKEDH